MLLWVRRNFGIYQEDILQYEKALTELKSVQKM